MGKYMKKAKISSEIDVSQSTFGVRTRAKTLALKRLQSTTTAAPAISEPSCYLQLRSRRLEKPSLLKPPLKLSDSAISRSIIPPNKGETCAESRVSEQTSHDFDLVIEGSLGENNLDSESRERSTRESTPCSLIRDGHTVTPGSRQRTVDAVNQVSRSTFLEDIPSMAEIEEFFARAEQQQQRLFIEKYNFDIINDAPLPGCYEWVRVNR